MNTRMSIILLIVIASLCIVFLISPIHQTGAEEVWDYVVLGSSIGTYGWPDYYGEYIENDFGVVVKLYNYSASYQSASKLLKNLRTRETLRDDILNAEVITIGVGFRDMQQTILIYGTSGRDEPRQIKEGLKTFRNDYDAMLKEVLSLCSTNTMIRVMDFFCPYVQKHKELGVYEGTKRDWMKFNKIIHQVAKDHDVPVAHVFEVMNGVHGDEDPNEKGYLANDKKHLNDEGYKVVAKLFRELGYD